MKPMLASKWDEAKNSEMFPFWAQPSWMASVSWSLRMATSTPAASSQFAITSCKRSSAILLD